MPNYINGHEFNVSRVSVQPLKMFGRSKTAPINYEGAQKGKLYIDTPIMRMPFGVSGPNPAKNIEGYSCSVSFDGMEKNPKIRAFYEAMVALDEYALEVGAQNSKAWFGKTLTKEDIVKGDKYNFIVKPGKDGHAPTMKFKIRSLCKEFIQTPDGKKIPDEASGKKLEPVIYTHTGDLVDYGDDAGILEAVPYGSVGTVRAAMPGLWVMSKNYGISLQMTCARVKAGERVAPPPAATEEEFDAAVDELNSGESKKPDVEEFDIEEEEAPPKVVAAPRKSPPRVPVPPPVEEDAEDSLVIEEEAPVPVPAPAPVKKVAPSKGVSKAIKKN